MPRKKLRLILQRTFHRWLRLVVHEVYSANQRSSLFSALGFRFSSSVHITSVHLRASSVLRVVVQSGDDLLGDGHAGGRAVTLPVFGGHGESRGERSAQQDIDVDVRDVSRCCHVLHAHEMQYNRLSVLG